MARSPKTFQIVVLYNDAILDKMKKMGPTNNPKIGRSSKSISMRYYFAMVFVVAIVAGFLFVNSTYHREKSIEEANYWTIRGSPCVQLSRDQFAASRAQTPRSFEFLGIIFSRFSGHVSCAEIKSDGGRGWRSQIVCQFTSPKALRIKTGGGEFYFLPGPGQPATVSVLDDRATCVMSSKFRIH